MLSEKTINRICNNWATQHKATKIGIYVYRPFEEAKEVTIRRCLDGAQDKQWIMPNGDIVTAWDIVARYDGENWVNE